MGHEVPGLNPKCHYVTILGNAFCDVCNLCEEIMPNKGNSKRILICACRIVEPIFISLNSFEFIFIMLAYQYCSVFGHANQDN